MLVVEFLQKIAKLEIFRQQITFDIMYHEGFYIICEPRLQYTTWNFIYALNYFILQSICKKVEHSEEAVEKLLKDVNRLKQEIKKRKQAQIEAARK